MYFNTNNYAIKKMLLKVALVSTLISSANAGAVLDLEVGGGMWSTSAPTGYLEVTGVDVDLATEANLGSTSDNMYMWVVIDHPIPLIPNLRVEQTTLKSTGTKSYTTGIADLFTYTGDVDTELDLSNSDFILYWGVPFATWAPFIDELDFGLGVKVFNGSLVMTENLTGSSLADESIDNAPLPYLYGKLRVEPPFMFGIGVEAELKYLSIDTSSYVTNFNETIIKLDWGLEAPLPILDIEAGIEAGYRTMSFDIDASALKTDVEFNGIFFGVYGKFGI